jgi:pyruvate formate lyase activating enzyme
MKEAMLWEKLPEGKVRCFLCAHECVLSSGKKGICHVRENINGELVTHSYGRLIAAHIDPIEKKPLFHFQPGSLSYSIATPGCNFTCRHCQNASISQMPRNLGIVEGEFVSPEVIVKNALSHHSKSISYTYTEPTIFFEYAFETAIIAHEKGLKNVFVTNGFMTSRAIDKLSGVLDGANIDLKAYSDDFYREICGGRLEPVKASIAIMHEKDIWIEVTTLIIPGYNDDPRQLEAIADFIISVDPGIPWHISAFYPTYRLTDAPPTSAESLSKARKIGLASGVKFVYTGNIPGDEGENTNCPNCGKRLIHRVGYTVFENLLENGTCPFCHTSLEGRW